MGGTPGGLRRLGMGVLAQDLGCGEAAFAGRGLANAGALKCTDGGSTGGERGDPALRDHEVFELLDLDAGAVGMQKLDESGDRHVEGVGDLVEGVPVQKVGDDAVGHVVELIEIKAHRAYCTVFGWYCKGKVAIL